MEYRKEIAIRESYDVIVAGRDLQEYVLLLPLPGAEPESLWWNAMEWSVEILRPVMSDLFWVWLEKVPCGMRLSVFSEYRKTT